MVAGVAIEGRVVAAFDGSLSGTCDHSNGSVNTSVDSNVTSTRTIQTDRQETGYLVAAGVVCLVALIFVTVTLTAVTERTAFQEQRTKESLRSSLKRVMTHKPSVCALCLLFLFFTAGAVFQQSVALYVQFSLGLGSQVQNCLLVLVGSCLVGIPVVMVLINRFGKRPVSFGNILILLPFFLGLLFVPGDLAFVLPLIAVLGMAYSVPFIVPWMMLSDVSDLLKLQTGRSYDTVLHGVFITAQRITGAVAFGAISATLEIGGYKSGDCVQSETVGRAIRWNVTLLPMLSFLASLVVLWQYPVTEEMRQKTKEALEQMRTSEGLRQERKTKSDENTKDDVAGDVRENQNGNGVENLGFSV
ncbi:sodium-dependent lysophosphatidylcholine symporter 1-B-like [Branchiostoma floridae x Branchiostoma belcheri]